MDGNAVCNVHFVPLVSGSFIDLSLSVLESLYKFFHVIEIAVLQKYCEFVSSDPEYRTVVEDHAYETACGLKIYIAFVVTILIVYFLQVITVKYTDGEFKFIAIIKAFLQLLKEVGISAFVSHGSERIDICPPVKVFEPFLVFRGPLSGTDVPYEKNNDNQKDS